MVRGQRSCSHQDRQLTGAATTHQVHLEETILGVDKTERQGDIGSVVTPDGRHAQ
jgi:hypothetical protein